MKCDLEMYDVIILPKAKDSIQNAFDYYPEISEKLGSRFLDSFESSIEYLKSTPHLFQVKYESVRLAHLDVFPYSVHFILNRNTEQSVIAGFYHHRESSQRTF